MFKDKTKEEIIAEIKKYVEETPGFIKHNQISTWISFIITITLLYTIGIKVIVKLFPQFSAQKDLFTYKD